MIRFLIRAAIFVGTAAIGLLIASWLVSGVTLRPSGFIIAVGVFALAQSLLAPFIFNVARQHAAPLLGGIGLVSTLVALIIASFFPRVSRSREPRPGSWRPSSCGSSARWEPGCCRCTSSRRRPATPDRRRVAQLPRARVPISAPVLSNTVIESEVTVAVARPASQVSTPSQNFMVERAGPKVTSAPSASHSPPS